MMGVEILHRGPLWVPPALFLACTFLNAASLDNAHAAGMGLHEVFVTPAVEELEYRLPFLLVCAASKNPLIQIGAGALSAVAFSEIGHDPQTWNRFWYYTLQGGVPLAVIARMGGLSNSYAAHAGINLAILTRALGS